MASTAALETERPETFERQVVEHMDLMYTAALRLTHNAADARDLQQDALVRALRFHYKFKQGTYIKAWLLTILRNTFINDYRKKARRPIQVDLEGAEPTTKIAPDKDMGYFPGELRADHILEYLGDEVRKAVDGLPEGHRRTLIMADLQGMTYQEIADTLDCPLGTVMSRLHRGRRLMRDSLPRERLELLCG